MSNALIVPMALDILMAPQALIDNNEFRRWKFTYNALGDRLFNWPEPFGFTSDIGKISPGTTLHWTLPRSLRSGKEQQSTDFPLVPNRWLIVRVHRAGSGSNVQRAWMLESDCPTDDHHFSCNMLITDAVYKNWQVSKDPNRNKIVLTPLSERNIYTTTIGKALPLQGWKEQSPGNMFLTAVAPGNMEFSGFVPFNEGVLSFYDDLKDVPDNCTLSYLVTGWYSDTKSDILTTGSGSFTGGSTLSAVLEKLNWTIAKNQTAGSAGASIYNGMAFGLPWNKNADPGNDALEDVKASKLSVAVGNTGTDAFTTMLTAQLQGNPDFADSHKTLELMRAFQYDLLPALNEINGDAVVAERVRQEWFSAKAGGTHWCIVAQKDADKNRAAADEPAWLTKLNNDQQALDAAINELHGLQWDLHAAWWKKGFLSSRTMQNPSINKTGVRKDEVNKQLDPDETDTLLSKVIAQLKRVNELQEDVPRPVYTEGGNAQEALLEGIAAFMKGKELAEGYVLKAMAAPRYWKPGNPAVFVSGLRPAAISNPDNHEEIRTASQVISAFRIGTTNITTGSLGTIIPGLNNTALPKDIDSIYKEFFLLDPANAKQIATKLKLPEKDVAKAMTEHPATNYTTGVLPTSSKAQWSQKWDPLYIEWEVLHHTIPYEWKSSASANAIKNWIFNGTDYELKATPQGIAALRSITGRSLLSPHTQRTFGAKLKTFLDQYGGKDQQLEKIYDAIKGVDNWRFLSQDLANLNDYLTQRDTRAYRRPTTETFTYKGKKVTFAQVTGYSDDTNIPELKTPAFAQGFVDSIPAVRSVETSDFPFHAIRSGQFYFNRLSIYDKFGRMLNLIVPSEGGVSNAASFPLIRDTAVTPAKNITKVLRPFQLPPRLLQHARLDMLFVDYQDDKQAVQLGKNVNPVCGWVINNHLDRSLLLFLPDGRKAGELLLLQNGSSKTVQWIAPVNGSIGSIAAITAQSEHLGAFVKALNGKTEAAFNAMLKVIDSTLGTTDPLGNRTDQQLSVLVGRPLALVRTKLQFLLREKPLESCAWPVPVKALPADPNIPALHTSTFSIRLGEAELRQDGVMGYFEEKNYEVFNSVVNPESGQQYVRQIGPVGSADGNYIHLPFDGKTSRLVTILADPRGGIHATTGILPVKEMQLPEQFTSQPLHAMELTFRMGPLLSRIQQVHAGDADAAQFNNSISYLAPAEKNGSWSWWQKTAANNKWQGYSLTNAPTQAAFGSRPATLHDGYFQFITDLKKL